MQITLKLYASLGDYLPAGTRDNRLDLEIGGAESIQEILDAHQLPRQMCHLVLINGVFVPPAERATRRLSPGDQLAVWPPVAGG